MKTLVVKKADIKREQHVIDAKDKVLGRLATEVAILLMGKHKPLFSRNADVGDNVTIINAEKVRVTGRKAQLKTYYWHSNYPGGFKSATYEAIMRKHPTRVLEYAVYGMLPTNRLRRRMMTRLKVYAGAIPRPVVKPAKPSAKKPAKAAKPAAEKATQAPQPVAESAKRAEVAKPAAEAQKKE